MPEQGLVEGATRLFPPPRNLDNATGAPGARATGQPFYNPAMSLNRDLSVLLVEAFAQARGREIDVADALMGTGARSLRLAHEVSSPIIVHGNDMDPNALATARLAQAANEIPSGRLELQQDDAHAFLAARRFDVVDLDPCGSPMPFLDGAMGATRHLGLVCATATDTGALSGTFPRVARRRYDAHHGLHAAAWRSEVGLRILAGAMVRAAARRDRVAIPVLSICSGHWMRVVCRVLDSRRDADAALRGLGEAVLDEAGNGHFVGLHEARDKAWAGPLWSGPLHEAGLVAAMQSAAAGKTLAVPRETLALLELAAQEADAPAFWVNPDLLQSTLGPTPRRDVLIARLRAAGHAAARTHLDPQGIRTDASLEQLRGLWVS